MRITNTAGIPGPVYDLITQDDYSRGDADISVTQLRDSPRIRVLTKQNDHRLEIDASKMLALTLGKAFHRAVEGATKTGVAERRLSIEVLGWKISGGMDHYEDGVLSDYKTCNVFKMVYADGGRIDEFSEQLNVYAQILRENGHPVTGLKIFALFKDWNRRGYNTAKKSGKLWVPWKQSGYPDKGWAHFDVPLWSEEKAKAYILKRVMLHQAAEKAVPLCTEDEIWRGQRCSTYCALGINGFCEQYNKAKETGLSQGEQE